MTVDATQIQRLMLTYTAVGLKGIGLWAWNSRWHGLEGGEYALTDRQGNPSARAVAAGKVAAALQAHRFRLWDSREQPLVGILRSWTNEAVWARLGSSLILPVACAVSGCDDRLRQQPYHPVKSMMAVARVLSALSIPWRYVTEEQLLVPETGMANITSLLLPSILALNRSTVPVLAEYVAQGGRLVADQPFLLFDDAGDTVDHTRTAVAELFGCYVSLRRITQAYRRHLYPYHRACMQPQAGCYVNSPCRLITAL